MSVLDISEITKYFGIKQNKSNQVENKKSQPFARWLMIMRLIRNNKVYRSGRIDIETQSQQQNPGIS
jgi:hypothetical protein